MRNKKLGIIGIFVLCLLFLVACNKEKEKMAKSKAEWQANFDSQFKIVAKIASDHNATITWCGTNNAERGDQWMVSQNNEQLGVFTV